MDKEKIKNEEFSQPKTGSGKITISKPNYWDGKQKIKINVKDCKSTVTFLEVEIDLDKFTKCITGEANIECDIKTRDLDKVGKIKTTEALIFELSDKPYNLKMDKIIEMAKMETPKGWVPSNYFHLKDSFFEKDGKQMAKTNIYKWE